MIEVKTADLIGPALDWAVAKADAVECEVKRNESGRIYIWRTNPVWDSFNPSTNWSQGGPLIDKYQLLLSPESHGEWAALLIIDNTLESIGYSAKTPLTAVCRAIVAAKLGDVVSVPAELVPA